MQAKTALMYGLSLALFASGAPAVAQQDMGSGFYLGASAGLSDARTACSTAGLPVGTTVTGCDDTDTGWKLYGGYQFTRHWGIEAGYLDFGKSTAGLNVLGVPVNAQAEATAWQLVGTATLPISPQFDVFGKLGIYRGDVDVRANGAGITVSASGKSTDLAWGVGAKWNLTRNVALRFEFERFDDVGDNNTGSSDIDLFSIGVMFRF